MSHIFNIAVVNCFFCCLELCGYRFMQATSEKQLAEVRAIKQEVHVKELNWIFPDECQEWIAHSYQNSAVFIAYYRNQPIGTVALIDPSKANRLYDGYGINSDASCYEIGGLALKKPYRGNNMIVLLGLIATLYQYSRQHTINHWIAISSRALVKALRRFVEGIEVINVSTANGTNRIGILYHDVAKQVNPSVICYRVNLHYASAWKIMKWLTNHWMKRMVFKLIGK